MKKGLLTIWKVMKILCRSFMILALLAGTLYASDVRAQYENVHDVYITLSFDNATVATVLRAIEARTDYHFFHRDEYPDLTREITISRVKTSVANLLREVASQTHLSFRQLNNNIAVLSTESAHRSSKMEQISILMQVSGKVTSTEGESLPGVNVVEKGTANGTVTDIDGNYQLDVAEDAILIFSFIGYKTQEVAVSGRDVVDIIIKEDTKALEEVVINAGYWKVSERERTGNIVRVSAKDIENQPLTSPIEALQGRMAGVEITQLSGMPGAVPQIWIRGRNSLRYDANAPLYIIDGVPVDTSPIPTIGFMLRVGADPLSTLNLSNIESIEVLKDADATAIYGSRGANGVVLISTKKGKRGKATVEINAYSGAGTIPHFMDLLDTQQYLEMRREAFANDGTTPTTSNAVDLLVWDSTRYTDWQKELMGGTANITNVQASVAGGSALTSFRVGSSFQKQGTIFPGDFHYQKMTGFFNLNHSSNDEKLNTTLSVNYGMDNNHLFNGGGSDIANAVFLPPNAPALYDENGALNWENSTWENPVAVMKQPQEIAINTVNMNSVVSYNLFSSLDLKTNLGYTKLHTKSLTKTPKSSYNPLYNSYIESASYLHSITRSSWIIEPQLIYTHKRGKGALDAMLGITFQKSINESQFLQGTGYVDESLMENLGTADNVTLLASATGKTEYAYTAFFGRLAYNWQQKYFFNLTGRRDGSSRFGPGKRFANLGAVGAAWIFSEEPFMKRSLPLISFGKWRASYGITGSDQIGDYGYLDTWATTGGNGGLYPTQLTNPNYSWETNKKFEAALELGFINDRIHVSVSWYRNRSSNQLVGYPLAATAGFTSVQANLGATVQNTGGEFEVNTYNIQSANFSWKSSANISFPKNKLIEFPNLEQTSYATQYVVGEPLNIRFLYQYTGLDPVTGLYTVLDANEDGRYDANDKTIIKNVGRKYYGGIGNTLTYKKFQLDFLIEFVKQTEYADGRFINTTFAPGTLGRSNRMGNVTSVVLERWQQSGENTDIQKYVRAYSIPYSYAVSSNAAYNDDASFIRLKTLSISYELPESLIAKTGLNGCKIYMQGQNLFTLTEYIGWDPQSPTTSSVPALRMATGGIQLKF